MATEDLPVGCHSPTLINLGVLMLECMLGVTPKSGCVTLPGGSKLCYLGAVRAFPDLNIHDM